MNLSPSVSVPSTARMADLLRRHLSVCMFLLASSFFYLFWTSGRTALAIPVAGATIGGATAWMIVRRPNVHDVFTESTDIEYDLVRTLTQPKIAIGGAFVYTSTILVLHSIHLYGRPTISYPLHGGIFAYIAATIYYQNNKIVTAIQLIPVAFVTYWSSQLLFPSGTSRVGRYSSSAQQIFEQGSVPAGITYAETPGFFILSGTFHEVTTLPARDGHLFVAVLIVASPIVMLLCLDRIFPSISPRMAQLSALLFATTAYTINRGVLPHTTSFFYIHTVIVSIAFFAILFNRLRVRYALVGWLMLVAGTIGHTFSGGAPLVVLLMTVPLLAIYVFAYRDRLDIRTFQNVLLFGSVYAMAFFGYELYVRGVNEVFRRASRTVLALHAFVMPAGSSGSGGGSSSGGTGGGSYSSLPIELLLQATAGELLLFFFVFGGICVLAFRNRVDFDMLILWIGGGFLLLALAVLFVDDIPAQRFYQILVIFGMNVAAATMVLSITRASRAQFKTAVLVTLVFLFAVFSIISPVAGLVMSPLTDEIPTDDTLYNTAFDSQNSNWNNAYLSEREIRWGSLPLSEVDRDTAMINRDRLAEGDAYRYSSIHAETGIRVEGASSLGGGDRRFFEWNPQSGGDHIVYSNGKSKTVVRR